MISQKIKGSAIGCEDNLMTLAESFTDEGYQPDGMPEPPFERTYEYGFPGCGHAHELVRNLHRDTEFADLSGDIIQDFRLYFLKGLYRCIPGDSINHHHFRSHFLNHF